MLDVILSVLPAWIRSEIATTQTDTMEEIRLRVCNPPAMLDGGREIFLGKRAVDQQDLQHVLSAATGNSVYTAAASIAGGYLTLPGGHRIGLCGQAIMNGRTLKTFQHLSSVSVRRAKELRNVGFLLRHSTLIVGPPGSGKTTLLRDCIRMLSDEAFERVCLADERGEVSGIFQGVPQMDIGCRTDVIAGCPKDIAVTIMLRNMNPLWIAMDEISSAEDASSVIRGGYCGVRFVATAHAWDEADLYTRPIYRELMNQKIFRELLLWQDGHRFVRKQADQ